MENIQKLLKPWSESIDRENNLLKKQASNWRQEKRDLYETQNMKSKKYVLNGVIIHQGEAGAGHYWAYIKDQQETILN
jgi:ubiquitin C-terminal hydrolase